MSKKRNIEHRILKRAKRQALSKQYNSNNCRVVSTCDFINSILSNDRKILNKFLDNEQKNNFEKCVKLYALLSLRLRYKPVFLKRNLSYLKNDRKIYKKRNKINIDQLLSKIHEKNDSLDLINDFVLKLSSFQLDLDDNKKPKKCIVKIFGFGPENGNIENCISKLNSSIVLYEKNLTQSSDDFKFDPATEIKISSKSFFKTIFFHIKINDDDYYLNFNLNDFLNSKSNLINYKMSLISFQQNTFKKSPTVTELIEKFRSNKNQIAFTIEKSLKRCRNKPKIANVEDQNEIELLYDGSKITGPEFVKYRFLNRDDTKYIEAFSKNLKCPLCSSNHFKLPALVNHLKYVHSRCLFEESTIPNNDQINVYFDELFDGSYAGNLFDFKQNEFTGFPKSRLRPTKRKPGPIFCIYNNWFARMLRRKNNFDSLASMHSKNLETFNRVYYHSLTNIPKHLDSGDDSDTDPEWLHEQSILMLNEFQDVNQGEKDLMHLWNVHCTKYNLLAKSNLANSCELFVKENLNEMLKKELIRNCILHFVNLVDYQLLKRKDLVKLIEILCPEN